MVYEARLDARCWTLGAWCSRPSRCERRTKADSLLGYGMEDSATQHPASSNPPVNTPGCAPLAACGVAPANDARLLVNWGKEWRALPAFVPVDGEGTSAGRQAPTARSSAREWTLAGKARPAGRLHRGCSVPGFGERGRSSQVYVASGGPTRTCDPRLRRPAV
jgi:hypothetical protein